MAAAVISAAFAVIFTFSTPTSAVRDYATACATRPKCDQLIIDAQKSPYVIRARVVDRPWPEISVIHQPIPWAVLKDVWFQ